MPSSIAIQRSLYILVDVPVISFIDGTTILQFCGWMTVLQFLFFFGAEKYRYPVPARSIAALFPPRTFGKVSVRAIFSYLWD